MRKNIKSRKVSLVVSDIGIYSDGVYPDGYQRSKNMASVKRIAKNFDPDKFGMIHVSERSDGTFWAMDGQHRLAALTFMKWGDIKVDCVVYKGLSVPKEAKIFRGLNSVTGVKAYDRFNSAKVEGDPNVLQIIKIVQSAGFHVGRRSGEGVLGCVNALAWAHKHGALKETLDICQEVWGNDESPDGEVVRGLGLFLRAFNGEVDIRRLIDVLQKKTAAPGKLLGKGRGLRDVQGGSTHICVADAAVILYNIGLRRNKLKSFRG